VQSPREKRIPKLPDGLADPADGKQMINDGHAKFLRQMAADANLVRLRKISALPEWVLPETIR
jgi:hypothetical protein